ncbi:BRASSINOSTEROID INSENSITIVE 1-associated receptor kinase 1 [Selaginella moellendorffii]|uniref:BRASSINOSTEROID INSENSITIVE 1-associated receptor kinase 1 n=1 Tax=Selaginella moellendorffii TaxID=88036 RepID=UPI000D1CA658|nr:BRASSINOSTEROID INSENSITIVE 1-associated receptor kinase 1 [Selaginella moellendorffii]|eukprot:XP_024516188.1 BRASSINOSTEROID INSENSITIVE 1-associated receptor kinase 1 [Selaginella moellendorffii]
MAGWGVTLVLWMLLRLCSANSDADALLSIKQQLGPSNANLSSWAGSDPCNPLWNGVGCTGNSVTALNLTGFGLIGSFPDELGNITTLADLDLQENNITGPVPESLSRLSTLRSLNLSGNPLQGSFPRPVLEIRGLLELRLGGCNLTGALPDEISSLSSLHTLHLNSNNLTGTVLDTVGRLSRLNELSLWGTGLNAELPSSLGLRLRNLTLLNLHDCGLQGPLPAEWGGNFTNMTFLHLYNNNLTGEVPASWSQMQSLQSLRLDANMLRGYVPTWLLNHATPSNIYLRCNYFSGPRPVPYPRDRVSGNCFDEDAFDNYRDHGRQCHHGPGCRDFFAIFPRPLPPPPPEEQTPAPPPLFSKSRSIGSGAIAGIAIGALAAISISIAVLILWRHKQVKQRDDEQDSGSDMSEPLRNWEVPQGIEMFSLDQISKATSGFSKECEVGCGGFGRVYRGNLEDGRTVAIKQASAKSKQGQREFRNEIQLLSRLHHRHLVRLLGFCQSGKNQVLVYEFMENGNLHDRLLGKYSGQLLDCYQRLAIAVAVAQGLDYLHSYADPPVIHRDLKPSNILLDGNLTAKISDFGISKVSPEFDTHVSTKPAGTAGYLDPEYFLRRQLTTASDVYSFGVVLLELVTGQKAIDQKRPEEFNLIEWVKPRLRNGGIRSVIDSRIAENFPEEQYLALATIALRCAAFDKSERPSIKTVLSTLTGLLANLEQDYFARHNSSHGLETTTEEFSDMSMYSGNFSSSGYTT